MYTERAHMLYTCYMYVDLILIVSSIKIMNIDMIHYNEPFCHRSCTQ